tara:strand:+ start:677 stop:1090 length:414 start_codon:yes stop_codon:yes gene_type:complete
MSFIVHPASLVGPFPTGADLSGKEGTCGKLGGSAGSETILNQLDNTNTATTFVVTSVQGEYSDSDNQQQAFGLVFGEAYAVAGASFGALTPLMVDSDGKFLTATSGKRIVALSLQAASAEGDLVKISPNGNAAAMPE